MGTRPTWRPSTWYLMTLAAPHFAATASSIPRPWLEASANARLATRAKTLCMRGTVTRTCLAGQLIRHACAIVMVGRCDNGRMGKGRGPRDPFGTYREWADHRYDPG